MLKFFWITLNYGCGCALAFRSMWRPKQRQIWSRPFKHFRGIGKEPFSIIPDSLLLCRNSRVHKKEMQKINTSMHQSITLKMVKPSLLLVRLVHCQCLSNISTIDLFHSVYSPHIRFREYFGSGQRKCSEPF